MLEGALAEIVGFLGERGIRPLLLKGAGTARWLYDNPHERPYADIDLLVAPEHFQETKLALGQIGFEPVWRPGPRDGGITYHEIMTRGSPLPVEVELHRNLFLLSKPDWFVWQKLSEDAGTIDLAGTRVDVPSPGVAAFIVVLHAVLHGVEVPKPMRDLERAVERADVQTWQAAAVVARELDAGAAFIAGLRLIPSGGDLADRLGFSAEPVSRLVALRTMTPPKTATGIERLFTTKSATARLRLLARELFPPPAFMRVWQPLACRGQWGLVCAYLWRPFWLAAKLPAGVRAWRRASRTARESG